jgi:hypothetical protein
VQSSKQKIVSRSSTEAELISLSDSVSEVIWCKDFLESQGYQLAPPVIYQDNMSTMAIAKKGKTRAMQVKMAGGGKTKKYC